MNICQQCGSGSRDKSGICAGCGAVWPLAGAKGPSSPYADLPSRIKAIGLIEPQPPKPWYVILLKDLLDVLFGRYGISWRRW